MAQGGEKPRINAKAFQQPLWKLAETLAEKVNREGGKYLNAPSFVPADLFMMMRHAIATYNLLFYINADERRDEDCFWNPKYGIVTAQIVRSMIDCLYNITAILDNPAEMGPAYRKSGLKNRILAIADDECRYGGRPEWDEFNWKRRAHVNHLIRISGYTEPEIMAAKGWPTLGVYLRDKNPTPYQQFLKTFTYPHWRQYSALSHAGLEAYIGDPPLGPYFIIDTLPHEKRPEVEAMYPTFLTKHIGRAATVLLCISTEIQAYFKFEGADINNRICKVWDALMGLFEAKELYDERYKRLMEDKGIAAKR